MIKRDQIFLVGPKGKDVAAWDNHFVNEGFDLYKYSRIRETVDVNDWFFWRFNAKTVRCDFSFQSSTETITGEILKSSLVGKVLYNTDEFEDLPALDLLLYGDGLIMKLPTMDIGDESLANNNIEAGWYLRQFYSEQLIFSYAYDKFEVHRINRSRTGSINVDETLWKFSKKKIENHWEQNLGSTKKLFKLTYTPASTHF